MIRAAVLAAAFLLGGCGLRPLYAGGEGGVVRQTLSGVEVAPIAGQNGWLVANALRDRLRAEGRRATGWRSSWTMTSPVWACGATIRSRANGGRCARAIS